MTEEEEKKGPGPEAEPVNPEPVNPEAVNPEADNPQPVKKKFDYSKDKVYRAHTDYLNHYDQVTQEINDDWWPKLKKQPTIHDVSEDALGDARQQAYSELKAHLRGMDTSSQLHSYLRAVFNLMVKMRRNARDATKLEIDQEDERVHVERINSKWDVIRETPEGHSDIMKYMFDDVLKKYHRTLLEELKAQLIEQSKDDEDKDKLQPLKARLNVLATRLLFEENEARSKILNVLNKDPNDRENFEKALTESREWIEKIRTLTDDGLVYKQNTFIFTDYATNAIFKFDSLMQTFERFWHPDVEVCTEKTIVIDGDLYSFRDPFKEKGYDRAPLTATKYGNIREITADGPRPPKEVLDTLEDPKELRRPKFALTYDKVGRAVYLTGGEEDCIKQTAALKFDIDKGKFEAVDYLPHLRYGRVNHCGVVLRKTLYVFGGALRIFEDDTIDDSNQDEFQGEATVEKLALNEDGDRQWFQLRPKGFPQQAYMSVHQDTDNTCILLGGDTFHSPQRAFWRFEPFHKQGFEKVTPIKKDFPRWFETVEGNNQVYLERPNHVLVFAFADWEDEPAIHDKEDEGNLTNSGYCLLRVNIKVKTQADRSDVQVIHKVIPPKASERIEGQGSK